MKPIQRILLACFSFLSCQITAFSLTAAEPLRVGVAEVEITPPGGFPIAGYYHERRATATRDPLKAKALVFRGDREQAAIVVCDLTGIAVDLSTEVRRRASASTGIPASHIIVAATHSHTAPDYARDLYGYLGKAAEARKSEKEPYAARLIAGIVEAIVTAHGRAKPVELEAGSVMQKTPVSFNRRFVMRDGSVRTWMSLDHPAVVRPAGPVDPEIGLLLVRSAEGRQPLGLLSNFALHLDTVGGTQWSADYPFYIEQALRKSLGRELVSIFGTGCCGDVNHVDPSRKDRNKTDFIGGSLARTIEDNLGNLRRVAQPTLRVRRATVSVPLQKVTAEQVAQARSLLLDARAGKKVDFYDQVRAYKWVLLDQLRNKKPYLKAADYINWGLSHTWAGVGDHLPVEVHALALGGDVGIVCLPGEIFVDLGLAIKRASPFRTTLVIELCNCKETIYVPTRAACAGGSYEVTNSALEPGSGEMLVEAAIHLLRAVASPSGVPSGDETTRTEPSPPRFVRTWGKKGAGEGEFHSPIGIAINKSDHVFVTDLSNMRVQKFDAEGKFLAAFAVSGNPGGIALDGAGHVYISLFDKGRIAVYTEAGKLLREWGKTGKADCEFQSPAGLAVGPDGAVYVGDDANRRVQKFFPDGKFLAKWGEGGAGPGQFGGEGTEKLPPGFRTSGPNFLAFNSKGVLYATDGRGGKVHRFTAEGKFVSAWGSNKAEPGGFGGRPRNLPGPTGICIDKHDRVWVAATSNRVQLFTTDGKFLLGFGSLGEGQGQFRTPHGLALSSHGHLYVVDAQNHRIQEFAP